ncbi:hypothetical protein ALC62_03953 [Cyphomyrmex costatus]|uniref:Uncharacterized protein n=1 Tax=Cyphomyrmex costatus TaxID=456900 RepID=A0A195CWV4_9HYME|nr:hypothetical protein ALC62_03953 [Cyphomyrmex costatus]
MTVRFRESLDGSRDKCTLGARIVDFKFVNDRGAQPRTLTTRLLLSRVRGRGRRRTRVAKRPSCLVVVLELGRRRFEIQNKTTPIRRCHLGFKAEDSPLSRLLDSVKLNPFNESEIHRLEKKDGRKARQKKYPGRRKTKVKGEESRVFALRKGEENYSIKEVEGGKSRKFNGILTRRGGFSRWPRRR